jgi:GH15 family glucan-1,4-alpha-glucosidase
MRPASFNPVGDYAAIGDCRSAALVSRLGAIEWLCLPQFHDPAVFAALLDPVRGGRFQVCVKEVKSAERAYIPSTNVLRTTFRTATGTLVLTDLIPVHEEQEKQRELFPEREVLRKLECTQGHADAELVCQPRPRFGLCRPEPRRCGALGVEFPHASQPLHLLSDIPLEFEPRGVRGSARLNAGQSAFISLTLGEIEPRVLAPLGAHAQERLDMTIRWWSRWAGRCRYAGAYQEAVLRSALALKLMAFAPSGAIIAAPTTSLPEIPGEGKNWDYRFCWLRDASLTMRALITLGYDREAAAFLDWMLHATRLTAPRLRVVYDVWGHARLPERELRHLRGYQNSRPVRVGNAASRQFQLDVYGPVIQAAYTFVERGGRLDRAQQRLLASMAGVIEKLWERPDQGIWESRGPPRHYTHSKVMCWVGLDRLLRLHEEGHLRLGDPVRARHVRDQIRQAVEARAFDPRVGSYTRAFGDPTPDASLLQLIISGFVDPQSSRALGTLDWLEQTLTSRGLTMRNLRDGPQEGAFGIACFWAVEALALTGRLDKARQRFEHLLSLANDVGLYAEEMDPGTGAPRGNFPQAFTHLGLINAAVSLQQAQRHGPRQAAHEHEHAKDHAAAGSRPLD